MSTLALIFPAHAGDRLLYGCVVVSILAHAVVMWHAPQVEPKASPPPRFTAVLREATPPAPPPQAAATQPAQAAEPPKPEPPKPQSKPDLKPEARAEPKPAPALPDPRSIRPKVEPALVAKAAPDDPAPAAPPTPATVTQQAVAPAAADVRGEVKGEKDAPRTAPAAPSSPTPEISDKVLVEAYQIQLASIIETRKLKRYPNEAIQNNWEGTSTVTLMIGADGKIAGVETSSSSGHDMLDEQARISLSKGKPFVPIPEGLKGKRFEARVRVVFSLKN